MLENSSPYIKKFSYKLNSYTDWVKDLAKELNCEVKDNELTLNPLAGEGFAKAFTLEKGFTAVVNNYRLKEDYLFTREASEAYGVIIHLYNIETQSTVEYKIDDQQIDVSGGTHYALRIVNAQTAQHLKLGAYTAVRGISIYLDSAWIEKNLQARALEVFLYLKEVNYFKQFINARQQRLVNEILNASSNHPYGTTYVRSRILRILDRLLENFMLRDISKSPEKINEEDFVTLQKVEAILTGSYEDAFPGIEKLSRISLMSESKLKKLFKQSFGMGLYEYYQKNRMHRAKEQIISGKFTISEVGTKLGYQNLSNFSVAFRKEFNCLPSELIHT